MIETIALEWLKKHKACKEGLKFVKRNKLAGFPVDRLKEIDGDFSGFVDWVDDQLGIERGNMTKEIYPDNKIFKHDYEYYENGQLKSIHDNGKQILLIPKF